MSIDSQSVQRGARHPLVAAAALLLVGVAAGPYAATGPMILALLGTWIAWLAAEYFGRGRMAAVALGAMTLCTGTAVWRLNQAQVEETHLVRFAAERGEMPVTLRVVVISPPENAPPHGNQYWMGEARAVLTTDGWKSASGTSLIKWQGNDGGFALRRGMVVEVYGWLSRPPAALNPGALNPREQLAADRVFTQIRVPRATGISVLEDSSAPEPLLARWRLFLRDKLLSHTLRDDVPAAYTLTALLLGYRDPSVNDVSQAFADAGVAHLLAISGSHIVFFTGMMWLLVRYLPLRPRGREVVVAILVGMYVLATPCGPPIVRAAVGLAMVLLARLLGRPRAYLNILAAAAMIVVLLRPADLADPGFQLSFVTTAGLILLSRRLYDGVFGRFLAREALVAELARTRLARWRVQGYRWLAGAVVANLIGAVTAGPLVALYFGQVNVWAVVTGLLALPAVSLAMVVAAMQLILEVISTWAGGAFSGVSVPVGQVLIGMVTRMARLPGAAVALRPPPVWLVLGMYGVMMLWVARGRWGLTRAAVVNAFVAAAVVAAGWYAYSAPVGEMQLTVLSAGQGSCMMLRTPGGGMWVIDAGAQQGSSIFASAVRPILPLQGRREIDGQMVTAFDVGHAREAGEILAAYRPRQVIVPEPYWNVRGQTLSGAQIAAAAEMGGTDVKTLSRGETLDLGDGCAVQVLWPPRGESGRKDLMLLCRFRERAILVLDPGAAGVLQIVMRGMPEMRCDAVVFTGPERGGAADEALRQQMAAIGVKEIVWSGRGIWAPERARDGERNTEDGAVVVEVDGAGNLRVGQ